MDEIIKRNEKGQFLALPPGAAPLITSANAREMVARRVEKYRRAALRRITDEAMSIDPTVSTSADAFGMVAAKQFTTLMDSDKPAIDQLDKLRRIMTGDDGVNSQRDHGSAPPNGQISASAATLVELAVQIEREIERRRDTARAIDGETIPAQEL